MPVFRFRVYWEEDDNIYRDIELLTGQKFQEFHEVILKSYEFDNIHAASFFESNDKWNRKREISSEVFVNKKDAPSLAMIKTPVSALVDMPDKKFIYEYDRIKKWTFLIELIAIEEYENPRKVYPLCVKVEGVAPAQTGIKGLSMEKMMEIEEKYDLNKEDLEEQGFTEDGEHDTDNEDSGAEDFGTNEDF